MKYSIGQFFCFRLTESVCTAVEDMQRSFYADHGNRLRRCPHRHCHFRPHRRREVVVEQVAALAKEHGAEELVLGHPVNMDGTLGPRSEKAKAMKVLLEEATSLPVVLWDERRTTIDAHNILFNSGKNAKQRKKVVDAVAASLILEGYLTFKKSR